MSSKSLTAAVVAVYITAVAYVVVIDIISIVRINNAHGAFWAFVTVVSGAGLIIAPFFAGLGWWYAPALIVLMLVAGLRSRE